MKPSFYSFIFSITFLSCIDQIELDTDRSGDQVVIFGGVNTSDLEQTIEIYKTTPFQNNFLPLLGAEVKVIDDLGNEGRMFGNTMGVYTLNPSSIDILPGRSYYLDITLVTGDRYQSIPQEVPIVEAFETHSREYKIIESTSAAGVVVTDTVLEFKGITQLVNPANQPFYLRWEIDEVFIVRPTDFPDPFNSVPPQVYYSWEVDPQNITLFNGEGLGINQIGEKVLARRPFDFTFLIRRFFFIQTYSMTRETYNFWRELDLLTNSTGSIFDVPPGKIQGNIFNVNDPDEEVLGFFEASNMTYERFDVFRNDGPFEPPEDPCLYDPERPTVQGYPEICAPFFCPPEDGCSFIRPPYYDG